ncbi:MAG TPA: hypothetical protein VHG08_26965, partial [Longimicrobium sp.]|nr:hypothetical protein [Longimicrobium sp.]
SSFSVELVRRGGQVQRAWTNAGNAVPGLLADGSGVPAPDQVEQVNARLNLFGRATLSSRKYMMRGLDGELEVVEH